MIQHTIVFTINYYGIFVFQISFPNSVFMQSDKLLEYVKHIKIHLWSG